MYTKSNQTSRSIAIRWAGPADEQAVERLAALETMEPPHGDLLVAEAGHEIVAALPVAGGPALADPFMRTAEIVELLALRARQLG